MNHSEKVKILKGLSEQELRREVLIPLLSKMGYKSPIEYHGVNEKGKDIICYDYNKLGEIDYLSIVAKTTDIKGDVSTDRSLREMIYQVEQSFNISYDDLFYMKQAFINEVWIVTTGKLTAGAQESVMDTLRKSNLDKKIKIIYNDRLVSLIDKHFETFWNLSNETKETVIIQRDRLLKYIENILIKFGGDQAAVETIKSQLLYSNEEPFLQFVKEGIFLSSASTYSIQLGTIDPEFDDFIHSDECGLIRNQFIQAKESFKHAIWEIEEIVEKGKKIISIENPEEFVDEYNSQMKDEYPFTRHAYGRAGDCVTQVNYLSLGIDDNLRFKKFLLEKGILDWFKEMSKSVLHLKKDFQKIIDSSSNKYIEIQFGETLRKLSIIDHVKSSSTLFSLRVEKENDTSQFGKQFKKLVTVENLIVWTTYEFRKIIELKYDYSNWEEPE